MIIQLTDIEKKYNRSILFQSINYQFTPNNIVGITGTNGSGKSTLLSIISSILSPSKGSVKYFTTTGNKLSLEQVRTTIALINAGSLLIPHLTVEETINYHFKLKDVEQYSVQNILNRTHLSAHSYKLVKELSSGMRQRLKLGLAFFGNNQCILLDEPTTNLDKAGVDLLYNFIESKPPDTLCIIASNEERDFKYCNQKLSIFDYKP